MNDGSRVYSRLGGDRAVTGFPRDRDGAEINRVTKVAAHGRGQQDRRMPWAD